MSARSPSATLPFGDPGDIPLLLVMGATASMVFWQDAFCRRLADGGRYVIRYDHRDTGKSSIFDIQQSPYTGLDMAEDAIGVLDAYNIDSAHIVGSSMGGMIAQLLAINSRERVRTITLASSTLDPTPLLLAATGEALPADSLPPPTDAVLASLANAGTLDWDDRDAVLQNRLDTIRLTAGAEPPFDEEFWRQLIGLELDRAVDLPAGQNHAIAAGATPPWKDQLSQLDVPTLVIHGTVDPILPFEHGKALADAIPGAQLLAMDRVGHALPPSQWEQVIPAILDHTKDN